MGMAVNASWSGTGLSWAWRSMQAGQVRACHGHGGQCKLVRYGPVMGMAVNACWSGTGLLWACRSAHAGQGHAGHGHYGHCLRVPPLPFLRKHTENIIPVACSLCVALYMGYGHGGQLQWPERLQGSKVPAFLTLMGTAMRFVICGCSSEYGYCAIGVAFTCLQHRLLFRQQSLPEVYVSLLADREYLFRLVCAQA